MRNIAHIIIKGSLLALVLVPLLCNQASAGPVKTGEDYFAALTAPARSFMGESSLGSRRQAAQLATEWFSRFDGIMAAHLVSDADRVVISRPINQQAERLDELSQTAAKIAKNYRGLSGALRTLTVPHILAGVSQYRSLTSQWYDDAAEIYEEMIRPKRPAQSMDELEEALNKIRDRSAGLARTRGNLKAMDLSLRKAYGVNLARHEDVLQQYVNSELPSQK